MHGRPFFETVLYRKALENFPLFEWVLDSHSHEVYVAYVEGSECCGYVHAILTSREV